MCCAWGRTTLSPSPSTIWRCWPGWRPSCGGVKKFSAPPAQKQQLSCGDLVLDRDEFTVTAGGESPSPSPPGSLRSWPC